MSTSTAQPSKADARPAVLHATIEVKRAATGLVETYHLIGTPVADTQETSNGNHPPDARPQ